jgi:hypothetical protein
LTTVLDTVAILLITAGVGWGLKPVIGGWCLAAAGVVLLAGSLLAAGARPWQKARK